MCDIHQGLVWAGTLDEIFLPSLCLRVSFTVVESLVGGEEKHLLSLQDQEETQHSLAFSTSLLGLFLLFES